MIPKIIHLCWISGDPYPEKIQKCIDSWKRILPDYKIILWDKKRIDSIGSRYVNEAVYYKKYAFAADFIRFYALYNHGGIYMDSDVEVLKPFDDLLHLKYFIGKENSDNDWEPAIMGAEPGIKWMNEMLRFWQYGKKPLFDIWGRIQTPVLPKVCKKQWRNYHILDCRNIADWKDKENTICRFPYDWFSPKSWATLEMNITPNTYCIHHFAATWLGKEMPDVKLNLVQKCMFKIRRCASWIKHDLLKK